MSTDKTLLLQVGGRLGIEDDIVLLSALGELGRRWKASAESIEGFDTVLAFVEAIAGGLRSDEVAKVSAKLGVEEPLAKLKGAADRLAAMLERLPDSTRRLMEPIGSFDEAAAGHEDVGLVRWPLIERTMAENGEAGAGKPSYSLSLGVNAVIMLEAGSSWPYSDAVAGPLLRLRAEGDLMPKASAKLPFGGSSASVTAQASAACAIEYFFAADDPGSIFALAVGERLGKLVDPFDFDAVWNGLTQSDLAAIHYEFQGSATLDLAISLADAGTLANGIKAEIGATIAIAVGIEGKYFLTFRTGARSVDGRPQVVAILSREKKESGQLGITFGGTIDLAALASKLHAVLAGALGEWDEVLQDVAPFLSPGTLLRDKASAKIDALAKALVRDEAVGEALARDLTGVLGTDRPGESALVTWLGGKLTGALDAAQGWASGEAAAADRLIDALGRGLPALAEAPVRAKLEGAASELIAEASGRLRAKVDALFASEAKALGKALDKLGVVANKRLEDADAAFAGVRALVARYDALFRNLLDATQDAARAKIAIAVQIEEARVKSQAVEVEGVLLAPTDDARMAFAGLTRGDFSALLRLMDGREGVGFLIDPAKSSLRRYASASGKFGLDIVAFGFGVSGTDLLSGEASVLVDGTGKVQVDAKGRLHRRFVALDAEREIELVSSYALVKARALAEAAPAADRSMGLAVTMGHIDEGLKRHEVERFVGSLADAGLVRELARERARQTFTQWTGNPGSNGKLSATLQLKFGLDRASLSRLLHLPDGTSGIAEPNRRNVVRRAFEVLTESDPSRAPEIRQAIILLAKRQPQRSLEDLLIDQRRTRRSLEERITGSTIPRLPPEYEAFGNAMQLANGMLEMVEGLRRIYFSTPEERADKDPLTWGPSDYRDAERDAVKAVRGWLQLNAVLFWTDSAVHPRTIAFLQTLASLAAVDPLEAVSLTIWRKNLRDKPETIVISHAPVQ
jgi:hypothetical protein